MARQGMARQGMASQDEILFYRSLVSIHTQIDNLLGRPIGEIDENDRQTLINDLGRIEDALQVGQELREARQDLQQKQIAFDEMEHHIRPELSNIRTRSYRIGKAANERAQMGGYTRRNKKSNKSNKSKKSKKSI
jgi:hypothetical protein